MRIVLMLLQIVLAALAHRGDVHRDTKLLQFPFIGFRQKEAGQFEGLLNSHTTMRYRATLPVECTVVVGVVKIDGEIIGETEHDAA